MCNSIVYDPHTGTMICEETGEVIEERLPEYMHPVYTVADVGRAVQGAPHIPALGKLSREVFEVGMKLRLPRYALYTAIAIARYIESRSSIRRSRLNSYTAAVIRTTVRIHGLDIGVKDIARAMGISNRDLKHFMSCLSAARWAADLIYGNARAKQPRKHQQEHVQERVRRAILL